MRIDREELAWAAGFFDGEGTFCATSRSKLNRIPILKVSISNTYAPSLHRFRAALGRGVVRGPYTRPEPQRPIFQFQIAGFEQYQLVGAALWPWLGGEKRAQFLRNLEMWRAVAPCGWECPNGHPRAGNTYVSPQGKRSCRICRVAAQRRYEARWGRSHRAPR